MDFIKAILEEKGGALVTQLASRFDLDQGQAVVALQNLLPEISKQLQGGASASIFGSLLGALSEDNLREFIDRPETLGGDQAVTRGNEILGHLLGSKETSRKVAEDAAANTEFSAEQMKRMLPIVGSMVVGMLSKKAQSSGGLLASLGQKGDSTLSSVLSMLDSDKDGSIADDLGAMAKKFF